MAFLFTKEHLKWGFVQPKHLISIIKICEQHHHENYQAIYLLDQILYDVLGQVLILNSIINLPYQFYYCFIFNQWTSFDVLHLQITFHYQVLIILFHFAAFNMFFTEFTFLIPDLFLVMYLEFNFQLWPEPIFYTNHILHS